MRRSQNRPLHVQSSSREYRPRPLITLSDQGESRNVPPGMFSLDKRYGWSTHADSFISANMASLKAIDVSAELNPAGSEIALRLRPGESVGAVPLYSPDTRKISGGVVVRPRFGWNGIGMLLQNVGWSASPQVLDMPLVPGSAREVPPWVLAGPILQRLSRLIREIRTGFHLHEELRQIPRGQVMWNRYVTEQMATGRWQHFPCRYPDLGPDIVLQQYLKWGVWQVRHSLALYAVVDVVARQLLGEADDLLYKLRDITPSPPDKQGLNRITLSVGLPTSILQLGLQALCWLVDERGLAGQAEADGLAWCLPMHLLFERWVEWLTCLWARDFGGDIRSSRQHSTLVPLEWDRRGHGSLGSLEPDVVVRTGEEIIIIDAKYKGHFEELDEHRWMEVRDELRDAHRHDLHQVLAYAALYDTPKVTAALVYPLQPSAWASLSRSEHTVHQARITQGGRILKLVLMGVPMQLPPGQNHLHIIRQWDALRSHITNDQ